MIGVWHRSNLVTFGGVAVAGTGVALAARATVWAVVCLVVAGMCDLLDGAYARRFSRDDRVRAFGVQLDSLADMVGFVALPAAVLVASGRGGGTPWWTDAIVIAVYALAAVVRLAFFNITTDGVPAAYRGVPVTYAALVLPLVWIAAALAGLDPAWLWAAAMLALAAAFLVDVRVPKPRGAAYVAFGFLAVTLVTVLVWLAAR